MFVVFFGVLLAYGWPHVTLLLSLAVQFVLALVMLLFMSIVTVSDDGIVLYRVNRLPWTQVVAARRVSVFGLPYLLITRHRGYRWWLPLYFNGDRSIEEALVEKAPIGNPIRIYAETKNA